MPVEKDIINPFGTKQLLIRFLIINIQGGNKSNFENNRF